MGKSTSKVEAVNNAAAKKRRRALVVALAIEGRTMTWFAARLRISRQQLYRSFTEPREVSRRVHAAIEELIAKHNLAA